MIGRLIKTIGGIHRAYLYILPGFIIYLVFVLIPIFNTFRLSFYDWSGFNTPVFNGLDNYTRLARDADFWEALSHNVFFVVFYTVLPIILALFLTSLMTRRALRGMAVYRVGLFIPQVMTPVVVGVIWRWLFTFDGPINTLLIKIGLEGITRPWLGDFTYARYAVGAVGTWIEYGFAMVLFIAGVQSIDTTLYEAAEIDGANEWQQFRHVTLPGLRQQILVAFVITFIAALRIFDLVFVLTRSGGPGTQTKVVSLLIFEEAFHFNRAGYASAMAVVLSLIIAVVSASVVYYQSWQDVKEGTA